MNASQAALGNNKNNESFAMNENASDISSHSPEKGEFVR